MHTKRLFSCMRNILTLIMLLTVMMLTTGIGSPSKVYANAYEQKVTQIDMPMFLSTPPLSNLSTFGPNTFMDVTVPNGAGIDCGQVSYDGVILYENKTCNKDTNGKTKPFPGETGWIDIVSDFNDITSSIYIGHGWSIKVFEHDVASNGGSWHCINGSMWDLSVDHYTNGDTSLIIDDTISSIQVFNNDNCNKLDSYEPDNLAWQARPIVLGTPQVHSIFPAGDIDWVKFQLNSTLAISLETTGTTNSDTRMWLYSSNLTELKFSNDEGTGNYSYISLACDVDPLAPGTYYVKVDEYGDNDEIPSYNLSLNVLQTCMTGPGTFNKTAPINGATNQSTSPTLSWESSPGAISYEYCYDTTNDNNCFNWISNGSSTTKVLSGLSAGTTYFWHVRAINSGGVTYANDAETAFWSFITIPTLQTRPIWRALLLVYRNTDVDYLDKNGTPQHLTVTMPVEEMQIAVWSFRQAVSIAHDFSNTEATVEYDIKYVTRPITSLTPIGNNIYWVSPSDTRAELDLYAPPGTYDSILVHWMDCDSVNDPNKCIESAGWGLAIGPSSWANGATYATVTRAPDWMWQTPTVGEVWLHEWLHGVCNFYSNRGYSMPTGDADGGGYHGYIWSSITGWGDYYRDLMTGQVLENGIYTGITPTAWQSGSIINNRPSIFVDYFYLNTLANYEKAGAITWQSDDENIILGGATVTDNKIYANVEIGDSFIFTGRVYIPSIGVDRYDSIGLAIRDNQTEYWATLAYGTNFNERNNISIMKNDQWGTLYPLILNPGWYTIKVMVDYENQNMKMKTWSDGNNEPEWQTSRSIDPGWIATSIGFRHLGRSTFIDDMFVSTFTIPGATFTDVTISHWAWDYIERLYGAGITGGCTTNPLRYCPESNVTRAQMAIFLEKGLHYPGSYTPPNLAPTFTDTAGHWAEDWIEVLRGDGITGGCGSNMYCPENAVTRAQMAVFLLKSKYGSNYTPPAIGASTGFTDVPTTHWAAPWIKQLAAEGITGGCGTGIYCPESPVTRAQMAVFLVRTFGLP